MGISFLKSCFLPTKTVIYKLLHGCSEPSKQLRCTSYAWPIEAVLNTCACAVALCTTAISKHGGGRRQCCEAVSLSLFTVRVKRTDLQRMLYKELLTVLSLD